MLVMIMHMRGTIVMINERFRGTQVGCLVKQIGNPEKFILTRICSFFEKKNIFLIIVTHKHKEAS